jgi:hypothetical protein
VNIADGQAMSLDFMVTRTNLPSLTAPARLSSNQVQFTLTGLAGEHYTLQASTNLGGSNWFSILTTNAPCATFELADPQATAAPRFYRALIGP